MKPSEIFSICYLCLVSAIWWFLPLHKYSDPIVSNIVNFLLANFIVIMASGLSICFLVLFFCMYGMFDFIDDVVQDQENNSKDKGH